MSVHLVLIDALNLIRRIYAVQERPFLMNNELSDNTKQQVLFNTQQACVNAVKKIIDQQQPTHILAVFDSANPCWRYEIFPDYKKGRKKMPEHLANHLTCIQDELMEMSVDSLISETDEADDLIATLAIKVALKGQNVTIISTDKCFLSMLNNHINVYDYFNKRYLNEAYVLEKFNVTPEQLIDLWTLTGDNTNKIPGVPGIGQITASDLLNEYGTLTAITSAENLKSSIAKKLTEHMNTIELSRKLLSLKNDIPLGFNLKDIRYQ
ncbi:flap endonuclease Xni [Pseudocolwellia agarivorans]|uniref:flap endonuclease Xni n=1 Tax=Pseudocolwellia agarivorans TaxID=1911682 RepID=UPI0009863E17|nr:flap endonuclease Xni [Pseudocolwellia agarivorans]